MRWLWRAGWVVALVVALTGCENNAARSRGATLRFGLHVPAGARPLGPLMPCLLTQLESQAPSCDDAAHSVVLAIVGRPDEVINDLLAQGRRLGFDGGAYCGASFQFSSPVKCVGDMHTGARTPRTTVNVVPPTLNGKDVVPTLPPMPPGASVRFALQWGRDQEGLSASFTAKPRPLTPVAVVAFARSRTWDNPCVVTSVRCASHVDPIRIAHIRARPSPTVGTPLDPYLGSRFKVLRGSRVIMQLKANVSARGNVLEVLQAEDVDAMVRGYRAQLAKIPYYGLSEGPSAEVTAMRFGGVRYVVITAANYA